MTMKYECPLCGFEWIETTDHSYGMCLDCLYIEEIEVFTQ